MAILNVYRAGIRVNSFLRAFLSFSHALRHSRRYETKLVMVKKINIILECFGQTVGTDNHCSLWEPAEPDFQHFISYCTAQPF
jgi:hypothetical protein